MSEQNPRQGPDQILFVDDEENILKSLHRLFMEEDLEVFTAPSGEAGLEVLEAHPDIGVIVSDQRMPGLSGVDFLARARRLAPLAIRILLTGYADIQAAMEAVNRAGISRYLTKPWQDEELVQTVRAALQNYQLIKENKRLNGLVKKQNQELKKWSQELEIIVQEQTMELQRNYDELKRLNIRLRKNFKSTIYAFSGLLELRDQRMRSHARNVAEIAARVAARLELTGEDKEMLLVASLLHDIGKIGIPDVMLQVPVEEMNDQEQEEYRKHPVRGQAALEVIEDLRPAGLIIRHHHERYDGHGFPDGLKRKKIPVAARIIAIVDYLDRWVRRFEGDSGIGLACKKAEEEAGTGFDPKLLPVAMDAARSFYRQRLPKADYVEMELHPKDLAEGMALSRDVFSGTGILLLSKGTVLNRGNIAILKRYHQLDPSKRGVFVSVKG